MARNFDLRLQVLAENTTEEKRVKERKLNYTNHFPTEFLLLYQAQGYKEQTKRNRYSSLTYKMSSVLHWSALVDERLNVPVN